MFAGFLKEQRHVNGADIAPTLSMYAQTNEAFGEYLRCLKLTDVRGKALPAGHYIAEETSELLLAEVLGFLR